MAKSDPHEDNHNIRLAQLLREKGLAASSLHKFPNGKFGDIYVELDHKRISLEAKVGIPDIAGDNALSDAAGRLADDLADTALGVCYPHSPHQSSQLTANSKIWISPIGGSWHETDIEGIAGMVRRAAAEAGDVDAEAKKLQTTLQEVQARLPDSELTAMAAAAGMPLPAHPDPKQRKHAGMRVLLLVFAAAMFHAKLDPYFAQSRSRPAHDAREKSKKRYEGDWPPPTLQECINHQDTVQALTCYSFSMTSEAEHQGKSQKIARLSHDPQKIWDALWSEYRQCVYHYTVLAEYLKVEEKYGMIWEPRARMILLDFRTHNPSINMKEQSSNIEIPFAVKHHLNNSIIAHLNFLLNTVTNMYSFSEDNCLNDANTTWKRQGEGRRSFQWLLFSLFHSANADDAMKAELLKIEEILKGCQPQIAILYKWRHTMAGHKDTIPEGLEIEYHDPDNDMNYEDIWKAILHTSQIFITLNLIVFSENQTFKDTLDYFRHISEIEIEFARAGIIPILEAIHSVSHKTEATDTRIEQLDKQSYLRTLSTIQSPTPKEYCDYQIQMLDTRENI